MPLPLFRFAERVHPTYLVNLKLHFLFASSGACPGRVWIPAGCSSGQVLPRVRIQEVGRFDHSICVCVCQVYIYI